VRAGVIGVAAACVVVPVAVLLSPLTPIGLARIAEPDPGFAVDAWTLVLGTALTASLVLAASLSHMLNTPRLAGFTWDAFVSVEGGLPKAAAALRADPKIVGYSRGGFVGVRVGGVGAMALVLGRPGLARPVVTAGVAPAAGDEIALGASTMRAAHTAIGQTVAVVLDPAGAHPKPVRIRVVGMVIVPPTPFLVTKLGEGAAVTLRAYLRIDPGAARQLSGLPFLVRFAPGVSRDAGLAAVANDIKGLPGLFVNAAERPANVVSLASIAGLPVVLSGLLALMAAATLAHTLASSTRRRRRDLAILKSLGFGRWQLRQALAWQATTIAAIALLIGLPVGIAGGRWAWRYLATQLGVLPEPAVPLTAIVIAIPAALVAANLIAAAPGQAAARIPPAAVLRTE
jgi:hypothetical protein